MSTRGIGVGSLDERQQFRVLFRTFFRRLFENDLVPDGIDTRQTAIWLAAVSAVPPMLIAVGPLFRYHRWMSEEQIAVASWSEKVFFLGYSMVAVGFLTVLVWDSLFPDRRDTMVLGTLPVAGRTVVAAKVAALVAFVFGFTVVINTPTTVMFAFGVASYGTFGRLLTYLAAHFTATVAAGTFVFFFLLVCQTTLAALFPPRVLRAFSVFTQLVFLVILIEWFLYSPALLVWLTHHDQVITGLPIPGVADAYGFLGGIISGGPGAWLPPLWFLGWYEVVLGVEPSAFRSLATTGVTALIAAFGLVLLVYAAGFRRIVRHTLESPHPVSLREGLAARIAHRVARATILRNPVEQAVFGFATQSLARSQKHRLTISIYIGVALAFIVSGVLQPFIRGRAVTLSFSEPTVQLLSIPLVLSFFTLVGLRVMFSVPTELRANWIFRMTESHDKAAYANGARKAMLLLVVMPIALMTFPMYWVLWDLRLAGAHTMFWLLLAALLTELLLVRFHKVPFACSYVPGKANVKLLWPVYLLAMTTYAYSSVRIEVWLLADLGRWFVACTGIIACLGALAIYRRHRPVTAALTYDEPVDRAVQVLHLMRPV